MNLRTTIRIVLLCAVLSVSRSYTLATDFGFDARLAREPAEVATTGGRAFRGILDGIRDGRLQLRLASDGGEVVYTFASDEIARFSPPGRDLEADAAEQIEHGEIDAAMPRLEALGRHRIRYLSILDEGHRTPLWLLVKRGGPRADPGTLARVIAALREVPRSAAQDFLLAGAELELALRVGSPADVEGAAIRWCALADPAGSSALGWRVLARVAYDSGNYEQARWHALQPITFGAHSVADDVDLCYALAIAAADQLADTVHAWQLADEMQRRQILWPADQALAAIGSHYQSGPADRSRPFHARDALGQVRARTPVPDTLDRVRKLPSQAP